MLKTKGDNVRGGCVELIIRKSLNVAHPPVTKCEYFFLQSISSIGSITDTIPNSDSFVCIEIKMIIKPSLPAAQDENVRHTPRV